MVSSLGKVELDTAMTVSRVGVAWISMVEIGSSIRVFFDGSLVALPFLFKDVISFDRWFRSSGVIAVVKKKLNSEKEREPCTIGRS